MFCLSHMNCFARYRQVLWKTKQFWLKAISKSAAPSQWKVQHFNSIQAYKCLLSTYYDPSNCSRQQQHNTDHTETPALVEFSCRCICVEGGSSLMAQGLQGGSPVSSINFSHKLITPGPLAVSIYQCPHFPLFPKKRAKPEKSCGIQI